MKMLISYEERGMNMFCKNCGQQIEDKDLFCPYCGNARANTSTDKNKNNCIKKLSRRIGLNAILWEVIGLAQFMIASFVMTDGLFVQGICILGILDFCCGISDWFRRNKVTCDNYEDFELNLGDVIGYVSNGIVFVVCIILRNHILDYVYMVIIIGAFLTDIVLVKKYITQHEEEFSVERNNKVEKKGILYKFFNILVPVIPILCMVLLVNFGLRGDRTDIIVKEGYLGEYTDVTINEVLNYYYGEMYDNLYWEQGTLKDSGGRVVDFYATQGNGLEDTSIQFELSIENIFKISSFVNGENDTENEAADIANKMNMIYGEYYKEEKGFDGDEYEDKMDKVRADSVLYGAPKEYKGDRAQLYKEFEEVSLDMSALELMNLSEDDIEEEDESIIDESDESIDFEDIQSVDTEVLTGEWILSGIVEDDGEDIYTVEEFCEITGSEEKDIINGYTLKQDGTYNKWNLNGEEFIGQYKFDGGTIYFGRESAGTTWMWVEGEYSYTEDCIIIGGCEIYTRVESDFDYSVYENVIGMYTHASEYALYDLDTDGVNEIIISYGTCSADWANDIWTIVDGEPSKLGTIGGTRSFYEKENDGVYAAYGHMDYEILESVRKVGDELQIDTLRDGMIDWAAGEDYFSNDRPLEWYSASDTDIFY